MIPTTQARSLLMTGWFRNLLVFCSLAAFSLGSTAAALAQELGQEAPAEKTYALGYALTILAVALGLAAFCRPGRRAEKPKMVEKELEHKLQQLAAKPK